MWNILGKLFISFSIKPYAMAPRKRSPSMFYGHSSFAFTEFLESFSLHETFENHEQAYLLQLNLLTWQQVF